VRRNADLVATAVAAAAAAAVVLGVSSVYLRTPFAILLLLILPGYALSAAIFKRLDVPVRILLSLSLSIGVAILGAIVLDLTPWGLRLRSWTVFLGAVTICAAALASARRDAAAGAGRRPHVRVADAFFLLLGLLILLDVVGLVTLARTPIGARHIAGYTALWMQREPAGNSAVVVGVKSSELHTEQYRLEVMAGGHTTVRRLTLEPGEQVQQRFGVPAPSGRAGAASAATVSARLFRAGDGDRVYRRVGLRIG
jgi:uncharacterized membrane protein